MGDRYFRLLKIGIFCLLPFFFFSFFVAFPGSVGATVSWYGSSWNYRTKITIDHNKVASSTGQLLNYFPVLISTTTDELKFTSSGGHVGRFDGKDILFTDADGSTKLPHQLENYASSTGNLIAWVQVPVISTSTDTDIYMYYGNASATDQQSATATWNDGGSNLYKGVWHMSDGTTFSANDSTVYGNNGTRSNTGATPTPLGKMFGAISFNGNTGIYIPATTTLSMNDTSFTVSTWVKTTTTGMSDHILLEHSVWASTDVYQLALAGTNTLRYNWPSGSVVVDSGSVTYTDGNWHYVVGTYDFSSKRADIYFDGNLSNTRTNMTNVPASGNSATYIGSRNSSSNQFIGSLDDVRISSTARSADWIKTEFNNQNSPSTFFTMAAEEVPTTPDGPTLSDATGGDGQVTLVWSPGNDQGFEITDYVVDYRFSTENEWSTFADGVRTSTSIVIPGLQNGMPYDFRISAVNITGQGVGGNILSATPATIPDAPTMETATASNGAVTVAFTSLATSSAWYDPDWSYRVKLSINADQASSTQSFFPVYVNLADMPSDFWGNVRSDGGDIRITDDNGLELARQVAEISSVSSTGELWFKANRISSGSNFYIYYGNSGATDYASTTKFGAQNVWDDGGNDYYKAVWHMSDGTTFSVNDSTSNGNNGSRSNTGASPSPLGKMFGTISFNGAASVDIPASVSLNQGDTSFSISGWIKTTVSGMTDNVILEHAVWPATDAYQLAVAGANTLRLGWPGVLVDTGNVTYSDGNWHYVVGTYDIVSRKSRIYFDGALSNTTDDVAGTGYANSPTYIGSRNSSTNQFIGSLDDIRVSSAERSSQWVKTEFNNQNSPSTFYSISDPESYAVVPGNGGSEITNYTVTSSPGGFIGTGTGSPIVVSGLTNGTPYTFTVTATNAMGTSSNSSSSDAVIPADVPGAPTDLLTTAGDGQMSLSWTAPANNGGAEISDYVIDYKLTSSSTWSTFADAVSTTTSSTVTGLTNGSIYDFRVSAVNAMGQGAASATTTVQLPTNIYYWVGGVTNSNTNNPANWSTTPGSCAGSANLNMPTTTDDVHFVSNCNNAATVNANFSVANLYIDTGHTQSVTLSGATLTVASTTQVSAGTLALGANNMTAGTVNLIAGTISGTTGVLTGTIYNVQSGTISAILGGAGAAIVKTTTGTADLQGSNTFGGGLIIKEGAVSAHTSANAFGGNGTGTITLGDSNGGSRNAALKGFNAFTYANPIILASSTTGVLSIGTVGNDGVIFSGGVTGTNNLTIDNSWNGSIGFSTGGLNNIGKIINSGSGGYSLNISSVIGPNVIEVIQNSSTSRMYLQSSNTFTGSLIIKSGTVIGQNSSTAFGLGNIILGDENGGNQAAMLSGYGSRNYANPIILASTTTGTLTVGTLGNDSSIFSGGVTGNNNLVIRNSATGGHIVTFASSSINNTGTVTNLSTGSNSPIVISAVIGSNVTGVIQNSSTSALTLSGNNQFSSGLTILKGTVVGATSVNAFGTTTPSGGVITLGNSAGGNDAATLRAQNNLTFPNPIVLASNTTGVLMISNTGSYANGFSGGITGNNNVNLVNSYSGGTITFSGNPINNVGTVTNAQGGSGSVVVSSIIGPNVTGVIQNSSSAPLTLSGNNEFSSGLSILKGTVRGTVANAFGTTTSGTGTITLGNSAGGNDDASLISFSNNLTFVNPIVLASTTTGVLTIGNVAGVTTAFTGGVTGNNNFVIKSLSTASGNVVTFSTGEINNVGTITNIGTGSNAPVTISSVIGPNVTSLIQNSTTSSLTLSGDNSTISGDVTITSGTLALSGTTRLNVAGNWSNSGTFTPNQSTVTFTSGTHTVTGANTFYNLVASSSNIITLPANTTQTISNSFGCSGTEGNTITINSNTPGTQGSMSMPAGKAANCDYLRLTDNNVTGGATWNAGANSIAYSNVTGWSGFTVPDAPTDLSLTPGTNQMTLSFTPPVNTGGSPISDYVVEYKLTASSSEEWSIFADGVSTATSSTITGLTNNSSYDFRVSAVNGIGQGAASTISSATPYVTDAYWVGGTGIWSDNHWALTSGGSADVNNAPTSTTNVHFDSNSGSGTVTVNTAGITVNDLDESSTNITLALSTNGITVTGNLTVNKTISGTAALTISGTNQTITGGNAGTISSPVTLNASTTFSVASGNFTINAVISGAYGLEKIGAGQAIMTGAVSFTGVVVKEGTLRGNASFGSGTITLGDSNGSTDATVLFGGSNVNYANPIILASTTATLTISNIGLMTIVSGGITGNNSFYIDNLNTTGHVFSFNTGQINNSGSITNISTGSDAPVAINAVIGPNVTGVYQNSLHILNLTAHNTFDSGVYILKGTVTLGNYTDCLGLGSVTIGNSAGGNDNATLRGANASYPNPIILASSTTGVLTIKNNLWTVFTGGVTGDNDLHLNSSGNQTLTFSSGAVNINGLIINDGPGPRESVISSIIGPNVTGVIQNSTSSSLTLSGNNEFSSGLTILKGTVIGQTSNNAFGSTTPGTGTITLGGGLADGDVTLNAGGASGLVFINPIVLAANASGTINIGNTTWSPTFTGGVTGTGNFIINPANGRVTFSSSTINNTGTVTFAPRDSNGFLTINSDIGSNVTNVIQNSLYGNRMYLTGNNSFGTLNILSGIVSTVIGNTSATVFGSGNIYLGNGLTDNKEASINVGGNNLVFTNPIILVASTTGNLTISADSFGPNISGGVTGNNNLIIKNNSNSRTLTFLTGLINNGGTITNSGTASNAPVSISSVIGPNVTGLIQNSATSPLTLSGNNSTISGDVTITSGTLALSGTTRLNVAGNWSNSGTFTPNQSTVTFTSGTHTVTGANTFYNLVASSSNYITLPAGVTQTISNSFSCTGTEGNTITIISSAPGTQGNLSMGAGKTANCDYLVLTDNNATGGATWNAGANSFKISNVTGWNGGITPPVAPTSLISTPNNGYASLSWTAPADTGGSALTDYVVEYKLTSEPTVWSVFSEGINTGTTALVSGLTNGLSYDFRVSAVNIAGQGSASDIASATPATIPDAPLIGTAVGGNASAIVSFTPLSAGTSSAWYNSSWLYRTRLSVNSGQATTTQTNFPVYVDLANMPSDFWNRVKSDGGDIRITNGAGTELAREVVTINTGTQTGELWFKADSLYSGASFNIYYGNSSATDYASTTTYGAQKVWDDGGNNYYQGVWHLPNGTNIGDGTTTLDSTSNLHNGSLNGSTKPAAMAGVIDGAASFNGSSAYIDLGGGHFPFTKTTPFSGEAWIKTSSAGEKSIISNWYSGGTAGWEFGISAITANRLSIVLYNSRTFAGRAVTGRTNVNDGNWHHVVFTYNGSNTAGGLKIYVDGRVETLTVNNNTEPGTLTDDDVRIGARNWASATYFNGVLDDVRLSSTNRSAEYIATEYNNQSSPSTFYSVAAQEAYSAATNAPTNGGSTVTSYTVTSSPGNITASSSTSPITITGLTNGTSYTFTVTATNAVGTGAASAASNAVIPATVPDAPTALSANPGNGQVSLTWTPPAWNGGTTTVDYVVEYKINADTEWQVFSDSESTATSTIVNNLTNGLLYDFRVSAVNAAGQGTPSSNISSTPFTIPDAPTNVVASRGNGQAIVSFTAPSDNGSAITSYTITSNDDISTTTSSTTGVVIGLINGTPYTFTVKATNAAGEGPASEPSNTVTPSSVPNVPTGLSVVAGAGEVSLSWFAPDYNGGAEISDYVVEYKIATSSQWTTFADGISTATSSNVTGLQNGVSYSFRVAAVNVAGQGDPSAETSAMPVTVPDAPTDVTAVPANGSTIVSFQAPSFDGGNAITSYTVTSSPGNISTTTNSTSAVVMGLVNGTSYTFTVTATNGVGTGAASQPSNAVIPFTVPNPPTNVVAVEGNRQATVTFDAPAFDGGRGILSYRITSNPGNISTTTTTTSGVVTGLTNGETYTFTVAATNIAGTGESSVPSNPVRLSTEPAAPSNLAANVLGSAIALTWSAPDNGGSAITDYIVEYKLTTGGDWAIFADGTNFEASSTVTGLSNRNSYDFRVSAVNIIGQSEPSNIVSATPGEPAQVRILNFTDVTSPSILTAVRITNEGSTEYEYQYTWCVNGAADQACGGSDIFSATAAKLIAPGEDYDMIATSTVPTPGNYYFHIEVVYGSQTSSASQSFTALATYPEAPGNVSAVAGNAQATVSFDAPSNGGSAITNYTVSSQPGGITANGSSSPIVVGGLTNGTSYTFTVTATNAVGTGPASAPSNSVTPMTVPNVPTGLTATPGNSQVTLSWTAPLIDGGSPIIDYVVEYKLASDAVWVIFADGVAAVTSATVTGLTNDVTYDFRVSAVNAVGQSAINSISSQPTAGSSGDETGGGGGYYPTPHVPDIPSSPVTPSVPNVPVKPSSPQIPNKVPSQASPEPKLPNEISATPVEHPVKTPVYPVVEDESGLGYWWILICLGGLILVGLGVWVAVMVRRRVMEDAGGEDDVV